MVWQKADSLIHKCQGLLESFKPSAESVDYKAWQYSFLQNRLYLCLWLAFICLLTFVVRDLYDAFFPLPEMAEVPQPLKDLFLLVNTVMGIQLILCLVLQKTWIGQRYPAVFFLWLSWSITLMPQIIATIGGVPFPDVLSWSLVFLTQAALIPVRWRLHLISQIGAIGYYLVVYPALGLTTLQEKSIYSSSVLLYLFWFCLICDLAVYLYERLQRAEFQSRQELQNFMHTVTHDLRTPIIGTSMVLESLLKSKDEQVTVSRYVLERMLQGSDRQMSLLNSLLEVHANEVQSCQLNRQPVNLGQLVQSALCDLEPVLTKNQVTLTNYINDNLPYVNADPVQLTRVFCNLIGNALKHNPPGISLTLDAIVEDKTIRCIVQDDGIGMNPQQCRRLFDIYSQGRRARYVPGLGLGLHLCRQIVTAHGGKIGVKSSPGAGAAFWFTLPRMFSKQSGF
jgi:signal transduction histidine kinase